MKILIVEDDFISRRVLHKILMPYGDCDIAVDGLEAIQAVEYALKENNPYELICLDIMMPRVDGFSALKKIRDKESQIGDGEFKVKIIITSALKEPEKIIDGEYANFANAYIVKPITKPILLEEMKKLNLIEVPKD